MYFEAIVILLHLYVYIYIHMYVYSMAKDCPKAKDLAETIRQALYILDNRSCFSSRHVHGVLRVKIGDRKLVLQRRLPRYKVG